jgi:hypothetical protein
VYVVLVGSGGGGTSTPGLLYLARLLGSATGLVRCCDADPGLVRRPWVFLMPPRSQSRAQDTRVFAAKAPANAFALTHELNALGDRGVIEYVCRPVEMNGAGASATTIESATALLADLLASSVIGWQSIAAVLCDTWAHQRHNHALRGLQQSPRRPADYA